MVHIFEMLLEVVETFTLAADAEPLGSVGVVVVMRSACASSSRLS
jgi:hypothetical protein